MEGEEHLKIRFQVVGDDQLNLKFSVPVFISVWIYAYIFRRVKNLFKSRVYAARKNAFTQAIVMRQFL